MANLAKSNTIWLQFWVRFLFVLSVFRYLDFVLRRFGDESRTLVEVIDPRGNLDMAGGGVTLDGVVVGTNTTAAGEIIVRVTGAGDPRTVTFYKLPYDSHRLDQLAPEMGAAMLDFYDDYP